MKLMKVPQEYRGNILFNATCVEKKGDVTCKPLWYAASKIHEAIIKLNDIEYLRSAIDCVESHPDLTTIVRGPHSSVCPNITITSWLDYLVMKQILDGVGPNLSA
uniref:Uncharacterized protein n=1 Tax=Chenopodium quinoa TaxID=63459 RepID=A0A803LJ22_CHEQI